MNNYVARPGSCRKPHGTLYTGSRKEGYSFRPQVAELSSGPGMNGCSLHEGLLRLRPFVLPLFLAATPAQTVGASRRPAPGRLVVVAGVGSDRETVNSSNFRSITG